MPVRYTPRVIKHGPPPGEDIADHTDFQWMQRMLLENRTMCEYPDCLRLADSMHIGERILAWVCTYHKPATAIDLLEFERLTTRYIYAQLLKWSYIVTSDATGYQLEPRILKVRREIGQATRQLANGEPLAKVRATIKAFDSKPGQPEEE